ncbi:hypothetical protein MMC27_003956 [Xylographa pallens]|nr:hypothetical protein [Xylographa pallens]
MTSAPASEERLKYNLIYSEHDKELKKDSTSKGAEFASSKYISGNIGELDLHDMTELSWTKLVPEIDCKDQDEEEEEYLVYCFEHLHKPSLVQLGPDVVRDLSIRKISRVYVEECGCPGCNNNARENGFLVPTGRTWDRRRG